MSKISHWYKWSLTYRSDGSKRVRRYRKVNGKIVWESYPVEKYKDYSESEIQTLLIRLNATRIIEEQRAASRYDFDFSYINKKSIEGFENSIRNRTDSRDHIVNQMGALNNYTFKFFIRALRVPDPNHWLRYEDQFSAFLLKQNKSVSYMKMIVQVTNRFLKYLHRANPNEVGLTILDPLSKVKIRAINAIESDEREKYISVNHLQRLVKAMDPIILPSVLISYHFGLRVSEVLGLEVDDVYQDCLDVKRQLTHIKPFRKTGPLKNRKTRSVEFWFATAEQVYEWIENLPQIHPDTLSDKFKAEMELLKLPFQFHDLRRTFITNALRKYNPRDVQLAVGHSDLRTTMKYAQDDRRLQRKKFKPNKIKLAD